MTVEQASLILLIAAGYLVIGVVVAIVFLGFVLPRLDVSGKGTGPAFRLMIAPGIVVLWPAILVRSLSGRRINEPHDADAASKGKGGS